MCDSRSYSLKTIYTFAAWLRGCPHDHDPLRNSVARARGARACDALLLLSCRAAWLRSKLARRPVSVQWLGDPLPIAHVLAAARDRRQGLMPLVAMTFQSTVVCGGRSTSLSHSGLAARAWP